MKEPEKKVDQSWKQQIERERERTSDNAQPSRSTPPPPEPEHAPGPPPADDQPAAGQQIPTPSLSSLVTQLAMQAMYALGLVKTADGQVPEPDLDQSRYIVDMIALLQTKTAGNLTKEEEQLLSDTLRDLRIAYINVSGG